MKRKPLPPQDLPRLEGDNLLEFRLEGKLAPRELMYVATEEDKTLTELFEEKPEILEGWGKMIGFHIVYLPLLMKQLRDKRVLQYRAPYLKDEEVAEVSKGSMQGKNDFLLQYLEHPADKAKVKQGFIRTEDVYRGSDGQDMVINRFYPISSKDAEPLADQLHRIGKQISAECHQIYVEYSRKERLSVSVSHRSPSRDDNADSRFNSQMDEENTSDLLEEVRERIAKLRQRGISQQMLEQLIHPDDRLSRLVITKDYRLLLPDYGNMEIRMEPLVKAIYLLFLSHPEGILFKRLSDYREELTAIYARLRPQGLSEKALQSIADVTNPLLNSINEKCARIRGAFLTQFDNHMARHYYIDGQRGKPKKILLPRNLVVWER